MKFCITGIGGHYLLPGDIIHKENTVQHLNKVIHDLNYYMYEATNNALKMANLTAESLHDKHAGVIVGTTYSTLSAQLNFVSQKEKESESHLDFRRTPDNFLSLSLAKELGLRGYNTTVLNHGTSGIDAIALACSLIMSNRIEVAIVCGADNIQNFDAADGTKNGAGAVVIESTEHAAPRQAEIYAEIVGYLQLFPYMSKYYIQKTIACYRNCKVFATNFNLYKNTIISSYLNDICFSDNNGYGSAAGIAAVEKAIFDRADASVIADSSVNGEVHLLRIS